MMSSNIQTHGPVEPDYRPPSPQPVTAEPSDLDPVEELAAAIDFEENGRKWLRAIAGLLSSCGTSSETDRRVQYAIDNAAIAACERAARILQGDLPP
jgi:hypothetical protein